MSITTTKLSPCLSSSGCPPSLAACLHHDACCDGGQSSVSEFLAHRWLGRGHLTWGVLAATVNVKPNLQIVADDVKCSHGCTVSDLEADQLFYLRCNHAAAVYP